MFERFTPNARTVVLQAHEVARRTDADEVLPAHLFAALVEADGILAVHVLEDLGVSRTTLRQVVRDLTGQHPAGMSEDDAEALRVLGIDLDEVIHRIDRDLGGTPDPTTARHGKPRFSRAGKKVLELSLREAIRLGDGFIGTEHVLLGLVRTGDDVVLRTLAAFEISPDDVRRGVDEAERRTG
jgi:ATP-dependent Clp protease ATP-binding subunit ClpA